MTTDKKNKSNSFITTLAKNVPLDLNDIKKDLGKSQEEVQNEILPEPSTVIKTSSKKKQSEKHLDFIANIVKVPNTDSDKGYLYVAGLTHQRLKKLSTMANVNLFELTDSIINDFFEKNKENIDLLIKKSSF